MIRSFGSDQGAAIAPLYALALFGLIGMAGVGFDYARLMTMDSELQNAADHAALAAATQLDGREGAMVRARDAANDFFASETSDYTNETLLANDGDGRRITSLSFNFYDSYDSETDTFGNEITDDDDGEDAAVVMVTVNGREVFYALTPIVGAVSSGDITADAVAGLQTAVCRVPPLMICVNDASFPQPSDRGKGIVMRSLPNDNVTPLAPGNFGFLNLYGTHPGGGNPNRELGENSDYEGCGETEGIETEPGFRGSETTALNTRFDMYQNPLACNGTSGNFCPAQNVRKNYVVTETKDVTVSTMAPVPAPPACGETGVTQVQQGNNVDWNADSGANNFPRDNCFPSSCSYLGDGNWDRGSYYGDHHPSATYASNVTRYETYLWELQNPASRLQPKLVSSSYTTKVQGPNTRYSFTNKCAYAQPITGTPLAPSSAQKDRRVLTVAAVDCTGLAGRDPVTVLRWVDIFLVEAARKNGPDELGEIFGEIIGPAEKPGGGSAFQFYGRNKPVLLR